MCAETDERRPLDAATELRTMFIACAAYAEYGFGLRPISLPNPRTNDLPAGPRLAFGAPATLMNIPAAAPPLWRNVSPKELKPSGAISGKFRPRVARRSLI